MTVLIENEQKILSLEIEELREKLEEILEAEDCCQDVSFALVDNYQIRQLHKQFLDLDSPTDVLSFPLAEKGETEGLLGEVVVSAEMALDEAQERGTDPEAELMLYMIHGFLHLVGYDDKDEESAEEMHRREDELMALIGYSPEDL